MSTRKTVSVVIPHYGEPEPTLDRVRELLRDPSPRMAMIVVSDDCSPTPFPAEAISDPRLIVTRRPSNGGFGAAVNYGLRLVRTPWALVLNSDAEFSGEQIGELLDRADTWFPAVASPRVVGLDGVTQWTARHFPTIGHQVTEWLSPLARFRHLPRLHEWVGHDYATEQSASTTPTDWVFGAVMLLPVEHVRRAGGFDESFHMNAEEVDLQLRLRREGIPSVFIPEVHSVHEGGGSSDSDRRRTWLVTARRNYARKWGTPVALDAGLTAATFANFFVNAIRQMAGRDLSALDTLRQEFRLISASRSTQ